MNKRFTLKESSIYNRNDVIHDNGIELPQSTACDLLNELYDKSIRLSKDKQLAETALMEYKEKVKNELEGQLRPIREVCDKYNIPLKDLPGTLEEYIAYDNAEYLEKLKNQW